MKFLNEQLDFLKKGSGIHIKKENRGKFTDYCGGKVTSACIAKGKSSSNPAIRKRATFAANARKWKHQFGGLLTNIDPRSDTTYKGYNPKPVPRNAGEMVGTNPLMDIFNFIETKSQVSSNPYLQTGTAPTPGKVNMSLYKDAKNLLKGPQYDEGFVNFVDKLSKGKINPRFITKNNTVSPANYNYVDLKLETVPKGFVKGNEVTPSPLRNLSEEGLVIKNAKPIKLYNPINTPEEAAAAKDWMLEHGYRYNPKGNPTKLKEAKEEVIKTTSKKPQVTVDKKIGNAKVNPHERYIDKKDYSKAIRQKDKYSRSMESEKASPTKSGNYRLPKQQIEEMKKEMDFHPYFRKIKEGYIKREANISYSKNPEQAKKQLKKDWQKTLEQFADFKKNGILGKKANGGTLRFLQEGGKNNLFSKGWFKNIGNKIGNFVSSEGGQQLLQYGLNSLLGGNSSPESNQAEMSLASLNMQEQEDLDSLNYNQFTLSQDPNNPNANAGIPSEIFPEKIKALQANNIKQKYDAKRNLINSQIKAYKDQNTINTISQLGNIGLNLLNTKARQS